MFVDKLGSWSASFALFDSLDEMKESMELGMGCFCFTPLELIFADELGSWSATFALFDSLDEMKESMESGMGCLRFTPLGLMFVDELGSWSASIGILVVVSEGSFGLCSFSDSFGDQMMISS